MNKRATTRFRRTKIERFGGLISKQDKAVSKRHGMLPRTATPSVDFVRHSAVYAYPQKVSAQGRNEGIIALKTQEYKYLQRVEDVLGTKFKIKGRIYYDKK